MSDERSSRKQGKISSLLLGLVGLALIVLAFIGRRANLIGFEEIGAMQLALLGLGALLISVAILTTRIFPIYQTAAIVLLNTLLLLVVELLVIFSFNLQFTTQDAKRVPVEADVPYFQQVDWGQAYWQEEYRAAGLVEYRPYIMWGLRPFAGEFVNVDENGRRVVPDTDCTNPDAYTIFIYGGSTMWGKGVPDWGTIPAYLQTALAAQTERPICILNFGKFSFVSTQEVISLMLAVRSGHVPDLAIFYDGINDAISGFNHGKAGDPRDPINFARAFEGAPPRTGFLGWVNSTYTARFISALRQSPTEMVSPDEPDASAEPKASLSEEILAVYASNYRLVEFLADEYDFDFMFIWQPNLITGDKPMTADEELAAQGPLPNLRALYREVWAGAELLANDLPNMVYLGHVFDGVETYAYYDHVHLVPEGNQIVGEAIADIVVGRIE